MPASGGPRSVMLPSARDSGTATQVSAVAILRRYARFTLRRSSINAL